MNLVFPRITHDNDLIKEGFIYCWNKTWINQSYFFILLLSSFFMTNTISYTTNYTFLQKLALNISRMDS